MRNEFKPGDKKSFSIIVAETDVAAFSSGVVHPFYATFALARDAEWSGRLFVLEMKDEDEEGIGTQVLVNHLAPALVGDEITFTATLVGIEGNEVITQYQARRGEKLIAEGTQRQKIIKKSKLERLINLTVGPTN